jgi:hypothetical protein
MLRYKRRIRRNRILFICTFLSVASIAYLSHLPILASLLTGSLCAAGLSGLVYAVRHLEPERSYLTLQDR